MEPHMNSFVSTTSFEQKVLIVEDDEAISVFLRKSMELRGISTSVAFSGAQAIEIASQGGISLMTIDYFLPDMTGESLILALRAAGLDIPFIMITGMGDEEIAVSSMKLGARDYLVKTVDLCDRVPRVVNEVLGKIAAEGQLKVVQNSLKESEERFSQVFENSNDGIILLDEKLSILDVNPKGLFFLGYAAREELAAQGMDKIIPVKQLESFNTALSIRGEDPAYRFETTFQKKNGGTFLADVVSSTFTANGLFHILLNFRDISERIRHLETVRKAAEEWRVTFDSITDLVSVHDRDMRIVKVNKAFADFVGLPYAEIIGGKCYQLLYPAGFPFDDCPSQKTISQGIVVTREILSPQIGVPLLITTSPIFDEQGEVSGAVHIAKDISDLKNVQEYMREREHFLGDILDSIQDGITILDKEFRIVRVNHYIEEKYASRMPLIGKHCYDIFQNRAAPCDSCPTRRTYETKSPSSEVLSFKTPNQQICGWMEVFTFPLLDTTNGELKGVIEYMRDITESKQMGERVKQAQKLESIGTLAAGIAHDFNNILTVILGFSDIVKTDLLSERKPELEDVEGIIEAGHRAAELVRQVLTFSRQSEMERRYVSFTPIVKETIKFLRASLPSTITIEQKIDNISRSVFADPVQLHQVIMNLCTNAHHAMRKKGGILSITLEEISLTDEYIGGDHLLPLGEYVRLSVSDTGHGMDEMTRARIFDPFFSTKSRDEGTGLGLSVVHGIIQNHGGKVTVYSQVNVGTTFRVYLPVAQEDVTAIEQNEPDSVARGSERILLVDDEKSIAELGKRMLSRLGYDVTACTDSRECLEIFRSAPDQFDLVLTDLTMPNMTGLDLAGEIKSVSPNTPVILMTGFANVLDEKNLSEYCLDYLVKKPVLKRDLAAAVRSSLDRYREKNRNS